MNEKTNEELLEIVEVHSSDYQPAALEEAKAELTERGVPFTEGSKAYTPKYYAEKHYDGYHRFWDYLIDMIVTSAIIYLVFVLFGVPQQKLQVQALSWLIIFVYYLLMEGLLGKTVGKYILGLKVVDIDGNKPSWRAIAIRSLCRFIPFEAFSFLFGSGWEKDHSFHGNWHDNLSKTYVVKVEKNSPQE